LVDLLFATILDLKNFVTAFGTRKNLDAFEVEGVGEGEALELETVTLLDEGVDGDDFELKLDGVEKFKFELVVELAPGLWG
jgi:hypothetical protein